MTQAEFNMKRIHEVATALSRDGGTVLDRGLGAGAECLSARQLVSALHGGIAAGEIGHIRQCGECLDRLATLAAVPQGSGRAFVREALRAGAGHRETVLERVSKIFSGIDIGGIFHVPKPVPALLALESGVFFVRDPLAQNLTFTCDVIPVFGSNLFEQVELGSVRVAGAIITHHAARARVIDVNKDGRPDFLRITVEGELAPRVREAVQHGQHIVDTISVRGKFRGGEPGGFLGQARLEFKGKG